MSENLDMDRLLAISALSPQEAIESDDFDFEEDFDDDDDEAFFEDDFDDDDDEAFDGEDDDDDDDEMFLAEDDDDDDDDEGFGESFPERRRRRRRWRRRRSFRRPRYRHFGRRRRLKRVKGSRRTTLRAPNGRRLKVRFGKSYATSAEVNKLIKDTEKKFALAVKERKANFSRLSKQIAKATSNLDGKVNSVRKSVKQVEEQARMSALMGLLQKQPEIKSIRFSEPVVANEDLTAKVEFERKDNMMTYLLISGALTGGSGGSLGNSALLPLVLMNK